MLSERMRQLAEYYKIQHDVDPVMDDWIVEVAQLEADRVALMRYAMALKADANGTSSDMNEVYKAFGALSQELRKEIEDAK